MFVQCWATSSSQLAYLSKNNKNKEKPSAWLCLQVTQSAQQHIISGLWNISAVLDSTQMQIVVLLKVMICLC